MSRLRTSLMSASALAGLLALAAPAAAQQAEVGEVVVTGSRIARQDYVSESPIVTLGSDQITAVGSTTVEDSLNQLPQFTPSNGAGTNSTNYVTTPGQAYANLRGLGPTRTLVLIDGRRVVAGNPNNVVDLNTVPTFLVESVETITGGASAVYGSDAIAGVVNFKLKRNFQGLQVDAQVGQTDRGDAEQGTVSVGYGREIAGGRGHLAVAGTWDKREGLVAAARDWSAIGYNVVTTGLTPSGAATILEGRFDPTANSGGATNLPSRAAIDAVFAQYGIAPGTVAPGSNLGFNADNTLFTAAPVRNFRGERLPGFSAESYTFNSADYRYLFLPLERWSVFANGRYELTDAIEAYGTASYVTYDVSRQLGPASASDGAFPGPDIRVPVTNPFIPQDLRTLLASRPNPTAEFFPRRAFSEVGGRLSENTYETFQLVGGLRGDLGFRDWKWDVYASFGRMEHIEDQAGNVSRAAMRQLTFASDGGVAICGGFDIFGAGQVSPGCAAYIARAVKNETEIEQQVYEANLTGGLFDLWAGEVQFAAGLQYRHDYFDYDPDLLLQGPDIVGFNPQVPVQGTIKSKEAYAELLVPLLDAEAHGMDLDLSLAGRISDYNTVGTTQAWKADLQFRPVPGLLLRGGYQRAVRAPNIAELFSPPSLGFASIGTPSGTTTAGDPCDQRSSFRAGPNAAAVRTLCLAQGVAPGIYDTYRQASTQVEILGGGNPDLKEETSDSFTAGVVWSPTVDQPFFRRFQLAVDWYRIELEDVVGTLTVPTIVGACFNTEGTNPTFSPDNFYCQQFQRRPSGDITNVLVNQVNLAAWKISGVDFQIDHAFELADLGLPEAAGRFETNVVVSYLDTFKRQARPGAPYLQNAGTIGGDLSGGAYPEWKWTASFTWNADPLRIMFRWRHIDSMLDFRNVPVFSPTAVNPPTYNAYDLVGWYTLNERVTLRAGVNNLTDKDPHLFTSYSNSNTDPSTYDVLGRRYFVGLSARF
ncbi:TonB-dependent receptor domain-containing protein [Phenylobacterium sp.]|uniref:TonB-dependent receptor domain-containing protein n=1 Tax=Phenylobacterium sp. TaxID=1871053 RepID=UPI0035B388EC